MKPYVTLVLAGISLVAAGCTMAPKYTRPAAPVSGNWPSGAAYASEKGAAGSASAAQLRWREFFTDAKLQQVIGLALSNNRDMRLAVLQVEYARALYGIQRATLYPSVNAFGGGAKQRASEDLTKPGERLISEKYNVDLGITSWEIDFFGRVRSLKDRALEEYLSTEQARRSMQIVLVSSVANAYLALAADRESHTLAEDTLKAQQAAYEIMSKRHAAGILNELDLRRTETLVDSAKRDVARYAQVVAQDENALTYLVGSPVPRELLSSRLSEVSLPKTVSAGIPSEVLFMRPDVLIAESGLRASYADIGAARAAFFPRITLTTAIGTASNELSGLFDSGTRTWSFVPQLALPIFDPRIWSAHRAAKVQGEMALARYEKAVQGAFREVADALATSGTIGQQVDAQQSLVKAVAETYRLSNVRYTKGIDSYFNVIDSQRSLIAAQQGLVSLQYARTASQIRLYSVLGGGGDLDGETKTQAVSTVSATR